MIKVKGCVILYCKCGGILLVIAIEEYPKDLSSKNKLDYKRVCDIQCVECGNVYYSQPYDSGSILNKVKDLKRIESNR